MYIIASVIVCCSNMLSYCRSVKLATTWQNSIDYADFVFGSLKREDARIESHIKQGTRVT